MISKFRMIIVAAAAIVTAAGCTDKTKFTVTGQADLPASGVAKIMLLDPEKGLVEFISDTIVNHKFRIKGEIAQPTLAFLFLNERGPVVDFMLETGERYKITVNGDDVVIETSSKEEMFNKQLKGVQNPDELVDLIRNNPTLVAPIFRLFAKNEDPRANLAFTDLKREFEAMGDAARNTPAGQKIAGFITRVESVETGRPAPDFTAKTPAGDEMRFSDVKAKVKVLDFWASWCAPCRAGTPEMVKLYKDYKTKGLEIVSFSLDDNADNWKNVIKEDNMGWMHLSDLKGWNSDVAALYVVNSIPTMYVMDENNIIIGKSHMPAEIKAMIEARIAK